MLNSLSISTKIWGLSAILFGMTLLTIGGAVLLNHEITRFSLTETRSAMMEGHESKLRLIIQSHLNDLAVELDGVEDQGARADIIQRRLSNSTFRINETDTTDTGYIFAYDLEGFNVADGLKPDKRGKAYWDFQDPSGKYLFREFTTAVQNGGGFVDYVWPKPGTQDELIPKLSYVELIPGTEVYIGTGIYIDDVDAKAASIEAQIDSKATSYGFYIGAGIVAYFVIIVVPASWLITQRSIVRPIKRASSVMMGMDGDLTKRIDIDSRDEIGEIARAFNGFTENVQTLVRQVISATHDVAGAATEIAASSENMAQGMESQKDQTMQISAAIEELSASVNEVASQSIEAAENAKNSGEVAQQGGDVVNETIEAMSTIRDSVIASLELVSELGRRGDEIGEIIAVINDIADQTNLLALNAAIEAARAGEHGRGFAVVADEVRKLADRTTDATEQVSNTIRAIQEETKLAVDRMNTGSEQVEHGVERARNAGSSLEQIVCRTGEVSQLITSIAAAAEEQSAASCEISKGVESISEVSVHSASGASEAADAANVLSRHAEDLQALVSQFRVE